MVTDRIQVWLGLTCMQLCIIYCYIIVNKCNVQQGHLKKSVRNAITKTWNAISVLTLFWASAALSLMTAWRRQTPVVWLLFFCLQRNGDSENQLYASTSLVLAEVDRVSEHMFFFHSKLLKDRWVLWHWEPK